MKNSTKQKTSKGAGTIKEAVRALAGLDNDTIVVATVTSVDEANFVFDADPIDGTASITEVRLRPESDASGFFQVPVVGSVVVIAMINDSDGFLLMSSQASKLVITSTALIQAAGTSIEILGSSDTAMRFSEAEIAFNDLKGDLDDLVGVVNGVINLLQTWVVVPSDGGAALKAGAAGLSDGQTSTADISPAEVPEVKLGN